MKLLMHTEKGFTQLTLPLQNTLSLNWSADSREQPFETISTSKPPISLRLAFFIVDTEVQDEALLTWKKCKKKKDPAKVQYDQGDVS